jgi:hypothetical protein
MAFNDLDHPFYRPLWRRAAVVISTALWTLFETFYAQDSFWMVIALGIFIYAYYTLIHTWKAKPPVDPA